MAIIESLVSLLKKLPAFALGLILFLGAGCSDTGKDGTIAKDEGRSSSTAISSDETSPRFEGCDLLLISIDTLRADRLPAYGYDRIETPTLDRLVDESVLFTQARTQAMVTAPSHMTLMTSVYPHVHQVKNLSLEKGKSFSMLPGSFETLAQVLERNGYRTAAFTDGGNVSPLLGFDRGFETFDAVNEGISIKIYKAHQYLKERKPEEKLFLFLHTYEVHDYLDVDAFAKLRYEPEAGKALLAEKESLADYDRRIEACDKALDWFFKKLKGLGRFDDMLIVFTSDHGENFYEHGYLGHFQFFKENADVPLFIRLPKAKAGGTSIDLPVGLVDLMPTMLDLMGIEGPGFMQGRSLAPALDGAALEPRPVFASRLGSPVGYSVLYNGFTLIQDPAFKTPIHSLFRIETDPAEKQDLRDSHAKVFKQLDTLTRKHVRDCEKMGEQFGTGDSKKLIDDNLIEELRKLGY